MSEEFIDQLVQFAPATVVYVSCNPVTQTRDLVQMVERGYRVARVAVVDLFPQTRHIETVVTMEMASQDGE